MFEGCLCEVNKRSNIIEVLNHVLRAEVKYMVGKQKSFDTRLSNESFTTTVYSV